MLSKTFISELSYANFVIGNLAPMTPQMTKHHIEWATGEELLELSSELSPCLYVINELEIWQEVKPVVKYIRAKKALPNKEQLAEFMQTQIVTRTLRSGEKISKTFNKHILEIKSIKNYEIPEPESGRILKELGDVLFFVTAAKRLDYTSETIKRAETKLEEYSDLFSLPEIRQANYEKLSLRYTNEYNINQDLHRKNE